MLRKMYSLTQRISLISRNSEQLKMQLKMSP